MRRYKRLALGRRARPRGEHAAVSRPAAPAGARPIRVVTLAERPQLRALVERADAAAYPEFMAAFEFAPHWDTVYERFADYQVVLFDALTGEPLGHANSVPIPWNGNADDLPANAVEMVERAVRARETGAPVDALGALQAVVHSSHQGTGLSARVLGAMAEVAAVRGFPDLFAPIRPAGKSRYPLMTLDRYAAWTRPDGAALDPWLRVHLRLGATPVGVRPAWTVVEAPVEEWERRTGMAFPEDGRYVVPGALVPVDIAAGAGRYEEPHLWMHYRIGLWEADSVIERLAADPVFGTLGRDALRRLVQLSTVRRHRAGEPILRAGGRPEGLHVVLSGRVRHEDRGAVADVGPLAPFGEPGSCAAVRALEDTQCLVVSARQLERALAGPGPFADRLLRAIAGRQQPETPTDSFAWSPEYGDFS